MDKRFLVAIAIFSFLGIIALLAYNYLEIDENATRYISPISEVSSNQYYALEKWLNETGHPVRLQGWLYLNEIWEIPENVVFINESATYWDNAKEYVIPWIESGNSLVICLDMSSYEINSKLESFLSDLGITVESGSPYSGGNGIPDFHWRYNFVVDEETDVYTIKDREGYARLAEIKLGKGTLTVIGLPNFMNNYSISIGTNAQLAWDLTGARAAGYSHDSEDSAGVLFIRYQFTESSFVSKIMSRGNLIPVIVSVLLVILLGFWMVVPVFGLLFEEKQKNSRPIRERFAAETGFLKKYKALDYYLETYNRELKIKSETENNEEEKKYKYWEIIKKLRSVCYETVKPKR